MNMVAGKHGNEKFRPGVLALTNKVASDNDMHVHVHAVALAIKNTCKGIDLGKFIVNPFLLKGQ
jgi:hypothetical protein